jgi:hypothetical protein
MVLGGNQTSVKAWRAKPESGGRPVSSVVPRSGGGSGYGPVWKMPASINGNGPLAGSVVHWGSSDMSFLHPRRSARRGVSMAVDGSLGFARPEHQGRRSPSDFIPVN